MASRKAYAYYLRGKQLALIEQDSVLGDGQTLTPPGLNDVGPDGSQLWKSPITAVTDGLEIEYVYSPRYRIDQAATTVACDRYTNSNGLLKIVDAGNGLPTSGVTHIVIDGSEKWNGLHTVNTLNAGYTILETKYNGGSVTEAFTVYTDVDVLNDESDEIDLPEYLAKALIYYVKAKIAEDERDMGAKDLLMKEFYAIIEKHESSKIWGARMIAPGPNAIR
jgi:hypothetical protein